MHRSATTPAINLHELQKTLDAQGIEIVENQKENVLSRKSLAERTKGIPPPDPLPPPLTPTPEFKKIPDGDKLNAFKTLLKGVSLSSSSPCTHVMRAQHTSRRLTTSRNAPRSQSRRF